MPIRVHLCAANCWLMRSTDVPCFPVINTLYVLYSAGGVGNGLRIFIHHPVTIMEYHLFLRKQPGTGPA